MVSVLVANDSRGASDVVGAIRTGDVRMLERLVTRDPALVRTRFGDGSGGTLSALHLVSKWPGHFPNGPEIVHLLTGHGADPDTVCVGWHPETPLHWAASVDDFEVADALLDAGADVSRRGGAVVGGTPLDNAVGYGCWQTAHRLVERGATVEKLWQAAALGYAGRTTDLLQPSLTQTAINEAFWYACRGGQRRTAELLLTRGADPAFSPSYDGRSSMTIAATIGSRQQECVDWLGALTEHTPPLA